MNKKAKLETVSYKSHRIKLDTSWVSVDPFLNLDTLKFGSLYDVTFKLTDAGQWYVTEMKELTEVVK